MIGTPTQNTSFATKLISPGGPSAAVKRTPPISSTSNQWNVFVNTSITAI